MTIKLIGAIFVVVGCTGFGYLVASNINQECNSLRQLMTALDYILCEISYRRTPLPELFRLTSTVCSGDLCRLFLTIANELERQALQNANKCILTALNKHPGVPKYTAHCITLLGQTIGMFNLSGQIKSIESVKVEADRLLALCNENLSSKSRCYKTLGISAGAALAIIFV